MKQPWSVFVGVAVSLLTSSSLLRAQPLLDVRFATDANTNKVGPAAIGQSATDFWNLYSRDVPGTGGAAWRNSATVTNLVWADGTASSVSLQVANAMGAWFTGSTDPMFYGYLYPGSRTGEITATLTQLPAGHYDLYVYAHGQPDNENGVITVNAVGTVIGPKATASVAGWNTTNWQNGAQYVLFTNVAVGTAQPLVITSHPGVSGLAVINGLQILQKDNVPPPWLTVAFSKVKVTQYVVVGRNYVLESSGDLNTWNQVAASFTAQSDVLTQEFDIGQTGQFFRIRELP
jgi:hypothetical protein